jgi:hypothetical protein
MVISSSKTGKLNVQHRPHSINFNIQHTCVIWSESADKLVVCIARQGGEPPLRRCRECPTSTGK